MDPNGIVLMGKAAESYVTLQWTKWIFDIFLGFSVIGVLCFALYWLLKKEQII